MIVTRGFLWLLLLRGGGGTAVVHITTLGVVAFMIVFRRSLMTLAPPFYGGKRVEQHGGRTGPTDVVLLVKSRIGVETTERTPATGR